MITPKQISERTMSPEKRKSAKNDYFAFYIGRPLSYILTIPFLYTNISPNAISLLSIVPLIAGFIIMYIGNSKRIYCLAWVLFFLWNLLDGVDGNVARYKKQFSKMGSVYDAMSGYVAMVLSFFGWGIGAAHSPGLVQSFFSIPVDLYIVLGALSGIFVIFPRLIMHKTISTLADEKALGGIKDKSSYGIAKIIALNLTSISGFVQVLMLVAVLIDAMDLFTISYFAINLLICLVSLHSVFTASKDITAI